MTRNKAVTLNSEFASVVDDLRQKAQAHIRQLETRFTEIQHELETLESKIPREHFITSVVQRVLDQAAEVADLDKIERNAKSFGHIGTHAPTRQFQYRDSEGQPVYTTRTPSNVDLLDYKLPAAALIAIAPQVFEPSLRTWASKLADELRLPAKGDIATLAEQIRELQAERETIDFELTDARRTFASFALPAATPAPAPAPLKPERPQRPPGSYDAHGRNLAPLGSDEHRAWQQFQSELADYESRYGAA